MAQPRGPRTWKQRHGAWGFSGVAGFGLAEPMSADCLGRRSLSPGGSALLRPNATSRKHLIPLASGVL